MESAANTFTLSGSIQVQPSSAIDADVNDSFSTVVSNNTFAEAQPLPNPVNLGGYANTAGQGASGNLAIVKSRTTGNDTDFKLTGNQTIAYVDFKDIDADYSNGKVLDGGTGCVDSGNNDNINFNGVIKEFVN